MAATDLDRSPRSTHRLSNDPRGLVARLRSGYEHIYWLLATSRRPEPNPETYVPGVTRCGAALFRAGLLGFVASAAIMLGATQQDSPFTLKLPGAWFFGIPTPSPVQGEIPQPGQGLFLGVVAVYGGMLLMLHAWSDIARITSRYRGMPIQRLIWIFAAWVAPLLIVAPLFSKDVYSYVAQGEQMTHGINPYLYGPNVLGATNFSRLVDPLWGNVSSPYGPVFLSLAGIIVSITGHHELAAVIGMRLLALGGTIVFAAAVPSIARSFNRDGATAFTLAALNPLVLLHLIAGAHNDALMLGLLVAGYAFARRGRPLVGILLCGVAAAVKVPALIGAIYIGWEWLGPEKTTRERLRPAATALGLALAVMAVLSEVVGLGWGWIGGLSNPDTVRSWMDPATAVGLASGKILSILGLGDHTHLLLSLTRGTALVLAALISIRLLLRSQAIGPLRALGWSLIAIVVLSPVVQPWYLTWGFVFLAPIAEGRVRNILIVSSGVACFVNLLDGHVLVDELGIANPVLVAVASIALLSIGAVLVVPRARRLLALLQTRTLASEQV